MGLEFSFVDETKDSMKQLAANFETLSCMMEVIVCASLKLGRVSLILESLY